MTLKDQALLLLGSVAGKVSADQLFTWTGYKKKSYFVRLVRELHNSRLLEFHETLREVQLLPPGVDYVSTLLQRNNEQVVSDVNHNFCRPSNQSFDPRTFFSSQGGLVNPQVHGSYLLP